MEFGEIRNYKAIYCITNYKFDSIIPSYMLIKTVHFLNDLLICTNSSTNVNMFLSCGNAEPKNILIENRVVC